MLRPLLRGRSEWPCHVRRVDSSVSAHLLKRASSTEGLDLVGVHMVNWDLTDETDGQAACSAAEREFQDVKAVRAILASPACRCLSSRNIGSL